MELVAAVSKVVAVVLGSAARAVMDSAKVITAKRTRRAYDMRGLKRRNDE